MEHDASKEVHGDCCTPALCVCGLGLEDGTPMISDYREANQPLPGFGQKIDMNTVKDIVRKRMEIAQQKQLLLPLD